MSTDDLNQGALDMLLRVGGPVLLRQMVRSFLTHAPDRVAQIRRGLERGDSLALESIAHTFKSSAAQLGASRLAQLCQSLETRSRAESALTLGPLVAELEDEFGRVERWLTAAAADTVTEEHHG